jgi:lysyl endopeptidase
MKKLIIPFFLSLFTISLNSQTSDLGNPISWNGKISLQNIPEKTMIGFNKSIIDSEDIINDALKDRPWRFGYKYDVNYNLKNSGSWKVLPNGDKIWQLAIECQGALTINLLFQNFHLPKGAYLYLYDIDQTNRVGAYTSINNRVDGELGSELVHGEKIIVEYVEPAYVKESGRFTISNVIHGYRTLAPIEKNLVRALNSSGDCNIDVNCPLGNGWDSEIRSVAMIVVGGSGICTGALVNNSCNDGSTYFLTANHCLGGSTGSWAFRFNWESPPGTESCATTTGSVDPGPPYDQTANGANILVNSAASDFALLEINNMTLTNAQNWNCFYAGWDASDLTTVTQATGIHHPSGDVKKICRENDSPYHSNNAGAATWYITQWEQGVTEPGSSGSPLFDQNHRIIGQLYGGAAACSGTVNNNQYDYYGRMGVSWNNGLDTYLAPTSCGISTLTDDGWDPNTPTLPDDAGISTVNSPQGAYCVDNFDPEITLRNYGTNNLTTVSINYDIDGTVNNSYSWIGNLAPGGTEIITLPNMISTSGSHTFNAYTFLPNGNTDSNPSNDAASANYSATIGGQDVLLEINTDCWGSEVTWTIEDINSNVLASGGPYSDIVGGEYITENICLADDCYDFIINDSYGDGMFGSQWGSCSVDGDYTITHVSSGAILASTIAANADYGNQEINNFCVTQPCSWSLSYTTIQDTCHGDNNGEILVNVTNGTGLYNYDIGSGPQSSGNFSNLSQGNYTIYVSDSNCTSSVQVSLNGPGLIQGIFSNTDVTCNGTTDGIISVTASGGSGGYTYDFGSGFGSSGVTNGLGAGNYSVLIQDGSGCIANVTGIINEPLPINTFTFVLDEVYGSDGEINITVSGGLPPYIYTWTGPSGYSSNNEDIGGLISGNYTLTITDNNGCVTIENILVNSFVGNQNIKNDLFQISPNPTKGQFKINYEPMSTSNIQLNIFDLTGRLVFKKDFENQREIFIDLSNKSKGTYLLKLLVGNEYLQKIIVIN